MRREGLLIQTGRHSQTATRAPTPRTNRGACHRDDGTALAVRFSGLVVVLVEAESVAVT